MLALVLLLALPQDHPLPAGPDADNVVRTIVPKRDCRSSGDEVVICADPEQDRYRYKPADPGRYPEQPPRAAMRMLGGEGSIEGVERCIGGFCAPAVMATLRIPFGGPKAKPKEDE